MELIFLGLLFFAGFMIIPVMLFLGFVLLKVIIWSMIIISLILVFTGSIGFLVTAGFVIYLFLYWLFAEREKA